MPDPQAMILLCLSAAAGGAVNSIAGGGTLLTFPTLLAVLSGTYNPAEAAVIANATSTVALCPGSVAGVWGYRREFEGLQRWVLLLLPSCLIGGALGSILVVVLPAESFEALVPWLILTATLLFALQPLITRWTGIGQQHAPATRSTTAGVILFQFLVGVYGGYFGAGIGILMLSSLAMIGLADIHRMNALKTLLASVINGTSVLIFIASGKILWPVALAMAAAAIAGGYLGARIARRLNRQFVRGLVVTIGFGLAAYYFYGEFTREPRQTISPTQHVMQEDAGSDRNV